MRLEAAGSSLQPSSKVRNLINQAYERVVNGMISSLDAIARESDLAGDDKEQLNAHVMIVGKYYIHILFFFLSKKKKKKIEKNNGLLSALLENMHHFYHELRAHKIQVLDRWVKHAKTQYESNLNQYIKVVIRRPLGRLLVRPRSFVVVMDTRH